MNVRPGIRLFVLVQVSGPWKETVSAWSFKGMNLEQVLSEKDSEGGYKRKLMRLHYLQHTPLEGPGTILDWAGERGLTISGTRLFKGEDLPDLGSFDMLVIMGGSTGTGEEAKFSWLSMEKSFIREVLGRGKIVVGISLGAQLMAEALGAPIRKNRFKEVGWFPVSLTPPAWDHPVFRVLPPTFDALHWHSDTFSIPREALHIASSEGCVNQAFLYGERVIGLQFHLEITMDSLKSLVKGGPEGLEGEPFVQGPEEIISGARRGLEGLRKNLYNLLDALKERAV